MRLTYFFSLLILLMSCGEDKKVETVNMEELLPQGREEKVIVEEEKKVKEASPLEKALMEIDSSQLVISDSTSRNYFPDRLRFLKKEGMVVEKDSVVYEVAIWEFTDSLQTINAFYNWLDCFGDYCESVKIGEEKYLRDKSSKLIWVSDHQIFYVKAAKDFNHIDFWRALAESYLEKTEWNIKLTKNPRVIMKWEMAEVD